jgi:hypothetical protein
MNSTIVLYTHNFLFPKLFSTTVNNAIKHAKTNDCELFIISHYPILTQYTNVQKEFNGTQEDSLPDYLKPFCIKNLNIQKEDNTINYVTGKLPYNGKSILNQLIFVSQECKTPNIILFEHDCFYPENYIKVVEENLKNYEMTYCLQNYDMLNRNGFYQCEPHAFLSSFSSKTSTFLSVLLKKREIYPNAVKLLEPVVPYDLIIKDINWKEKENKIVKRLIRPKTYKDIGARVVGNTVTHADKEPVTHNSICIDEALQENHSVLELQHGLNTSNSLSLMRNIYDNSELEEEYRTSSEVHPYWGNAQYFIDMFEKVEKTELTYKMHKLGTHQCNL